MRGLESKRSKHLPSHLRLPAEHACENYVCEIGAVCMLPIASRRLVLPRKIVLSGCGSLCTDATHLASTIESAIL